MLGNGEEHASAAVMVKVSVPDSEMLSRSKDCQVYESHTVRYICSRISDCLVLYCGMDCGA